MRSINNGWISICVILVAIAAVVFVFRILRGILSVVLPIAIISGAGYYVYTNYVRNRKDSAER